MSKLISHIKRNSYYKSHKTLEAATYELYNLVNNDRFNDFISKLYKVHSKAEILKFLQEFINWIDIECTPYDIELLTKSKFIERVSYDIKLH